MSTYHRDTIARLIGRIYDAVLDPLHWVDFLNDLGAVVDGHGLNLSLINPSNGTVVYGLAARVDQQFVHDYRKYYSTLDPWLAEGRRRNLLRHGLIALGEPIVPATVLKRTEFYNDFGRYYQFCGGVGALFDVDRSLMSLSFSGYKFGQYNRSELRLVRALASHLERAMKIHLRLEGVGITPAWAGAALDRFNCGVLFVSASGTLLFANQVGREILHGRDGISTLHGELFAETPNETAKVREAIAMALRVREGEIPAPRTVVIRRSLNRRPLSILVAPLPRGPGLAGFATAAVAIFVTDPERSVPTHAETIRVRLGLTPSEAQLAQLLASGRSVAEAADDLSIRLETARKRLKLIFHKTDTHRQSDLVRLVLLCTTMGAVG